MTNVKNFTQQELSNQWFTMENALLECSIAHGLRTDDIKIMKSKNQGVYYLIGNERNEKGQPTKVYFKKDFR